MATCEIILITGGTRSGKSRRALELSQGNTKFFIATAQPLDEEMLLRIEEHRRQRDAHWLTVEEPVDLAGTIDKIPEGTVVIDCLTLWLSNLLLHSWSDEQIKEQAQCLVNAILRRQDRTILVTNEVGLGIVPDNELGRRFRDLAGAMNQAIAGCAHTVILMVCGLPLFLKQREV